MTTAAACRLTDLPDIHGDLIGPDDVGQPEYFISHAWSMAFLDLLDCVFNHLQVRQWAKGVRQRPGVCGRERGGVCQGAHSTSWTCWTAY